MALTPEQQAQFEMQKELDNIRQVNALAASKEQQVNALALNEAQKLSQLETLKFSLDKELEMQNKQNRLETLRLAKETLIENARAKPVDSRQITVEDIENFAKSLESYINK